MTSSLWRGIANGLMLEAIAAVIVWSLAVGRFDVAAAVAVVAAVVVTAQVST